MHLQKMSYFHPLMKPEALREYFPKGSTTGFLIIGGAVLFLILEKNNVLAGMPVKEQILCSLFHSVTARTAGFNTTDTGALTEGSKLVTMILMFIGGSPGSTAIQLQCFQKKVFLL